MTDDRPMTLDQACRELLNNLVRPKTLRAAIEQGTLQAERLGRRLVVTPSDIVEWRKQCRDTQKARVSISQKNRVEKPIGSSETEANACLQDALLQRVEKLRKRLPPTLPENTSRSSTVVLLRSETSC